MIATWSMGLADANMSEDILVEQSQLIRRHPWWQARAKLTLELLDRLGVRPPARVLDAGCGWGVTLATLEQRGYRVVGMDVSRRALEMLNQERPGRQLAEADLTQALPSGLEGYDAVLALDVIEHLDDDRAAIERLAQLTSRGGVLVVSVPALPEMFSDFDAIQGHRRRYTPETLRKAFTDTDLRVERVFWWGSWLVPALRRQRRQRWQATSSETVSQAFRHYLRLPPWPGPWVLQLAFAWEQERALVGRLTSGTSLFAVARRQGRIAT